jgi:DNA-binding NtrC family response regulator
LRDRPDDIPILAAHCLERMARGGPGPAKRLSPAAVRALLTHPWPGNVRELSNVLARAHALGRGPVIDVDALGLGVGIRGTVSPLEQALALPYSEAKEAFARAYLAALLERHGGNLSRAAAAAAIYRKSLQRLLKQYGLERRANPTEG